jgi:hypothetical protein
MLYSASLIFASKARPYLSRVPYIFLANIRLVFRASIVFESHAKALLNTQYLSLLDAAVLTHKAGLFYGRIRYLRVRPEH